MWITAFSFIPLLLLTAPAMAKVYQCVTEDSVQFSSIPCDDQSAGFPVAQKTDTGVIEKFILPVYPDWYKGWQQTAIFQLSSYSEIEYVPIQPHAKEIPALVNQQQLNHVASSFTVQDMAVSIKDTIESLCKNTQLQNVNIENHNPGKVFYGQYSCSARRDTQHGELGVYKIMRGENSVYVAAVKWDVAPFTIYPGQNPQPLENKRLTNRLQTAKKYLQQDVRLCKGNICY